MNVLLSIALLVTGIFVFGAALLVPHERSREIGPGEVALLSASDRASAFGGAPSTVVQRSGGGHRRASDVRSPGAGVAAVHSMQFSAVASPAEDTTTPVAIADSPGYDWRKASAADPAPDRGKRALEVEPDSRDVVAPGLRQKPDRRSSGETAATGEATCWTAESYGHIGGLADHGPADLPGDGNHGEATTCDVRSAIVVAAATESDTAPANAGFDQRAALLRAREAVDAAGLVDLVRNATLVIAVEAAYDLRERAGIDCLNAVLLSFADPPREALIRLHLP